MLGQLNLKRKTVLVVLGTLLTSMLVIWFSTNSVLLINRANTLWDEFLQHDRVASSSLHTIQTTMGYGGFIHDFKNYVLRRDKAYGKSLLRHKKALEDAIDKYYDLDLTDEEIEALGTLEGTVEQYWRNYVTATSRECVDLSPQELDILVRVDDGPSIEALKVLDNARIAYSEKIHKETGAALKRASELAFIGWVAVPGIMVFGWLLVHFMQQVFQATAEAEKHRNELNALLEASPDAMINVAPGGKIVRANRGAVELFGFSLEELLAMQLEELVPAEFQKNHKKMRREYFATPTKRPMEQAGQLVAKHKDGRHIPVEVSLNYIVRDGETLVIATVRNVAERIAAERKTLKLLSDNRTLARRNMETQEAERHRLSRELHDELGQQVTAIRINAELIEKSCTQDQAATLEHADEIKIIAADLVQNIRSITNGLRPANLDYLGLTDTLIEHTDQWQRRHPDIELDFVIEGELDGFSEEVNISLFRLAQESLTNIEKHAFATEVSLTLKREDDYVRLEVKDNGRGTHKGRQHRGIGIHGMEERTRALNGDFNFISKPGYGALVQILIPVSMAAEKS